MNLPSASALAHPNIAFIKYWGNRDNELRLPMNGSISMNLDGLHTRTKVSWIDDPAVLNDSLYINGIPQDGGTLHRVTSFLNLVRQLVQFSSRAEVSSETNFPSGVGIASSASAFAALSLAATKAAGLTLDPVALSRLARHGSGSACRSIPSGFVEWQVGISDDTSYAISIAPPDHWSLVDVIAIVSDSHKKIGSSEGHALAGTSSLQSARLENAPRRLDVCRRAILDRDFSTLADIVELDSNLMHAVMMTSTPSLFYWQESTLTVMKAVQKARQEGLKVCFTVDAGPNVHVITESKSKGDVIELVGKINGVRDILTSTVGGPVHLVDVE